MLPSNLTFRAAWSALAGLLVVAGCGAPLTTGQAPDFYATQAQARIYALDATSFEVVPPIGAEGAAYWCAAADFARHRLGAGWSQDIYVQKGRADSVVNGRIETVTFTLDPTARAEPLTLIRRAYGFKPGDRFSLSTAEGFCRELEPLPFL
ncbi:hypothetical protein [Tritonibacter horizontis]|uniref:Uncharacterized protein n=1 Tax=Tritonibacter horizontis TaxID=1768241 RepID=A0A132BUL1_9RHOB|nr:hypothetical protein [Tritonibacter horizontis]KUP92078.1 hypothetical protein TRIHO_30970 [Tritonibacter horizontis]